MLRKYNLMVLRAILCLPIIALSGKIVAMKDQIYLDEKERIKHLDRIEKLKDLFDLNNRGKDVFNMGGGKNDSLKKDFESNNVVHKKEIRWVESDKKILKIGRTRDGVGIIEEFTNVFSFTYNDDELFFIQYLNNTGELISFGDEKQVRGIFKDTICAHFSPNNKFLIVAHDDYEREIFDIENNKSLVKGEMESFTDIIGQLCYLKRFRFSKPVVLFREKLNSMRALAANGAQATNGELDGSKKNSFCDLRIYTQ